jgi:hypothetical protein
MRALAIGVALVAAGSITVAAPAAAAAAPPVLCGAVLTANATLTHDLHCASGIGVTLDGDVVLDLAGHLLSGPGAASDLNSIGVALTETGTPRVQNGTISGWATGTGPSPENGGFGLVNATFRSLTYSDNGTGVLGSASTFDVTGARFLRNSFAGISGLTTRATVRNSSFASNGRAISLSDGGSLTLGGSVVEHNGVGVSCNEVTCTITQSWLRYNTTAIAAFLATGKIALNDIRKNGIGFRTDFDPDPGFAHELALNLFTGNGSAVVVNDVGTVYVHDNLFVANGVGVTVPSPEFTFTAVLVRNAFTRNGDGVFISSAGATLKQNVATYNRGWGIRAVAAVDLGGNIASGNGRSPQCVGVTCASHR